MQLLKQSYVLFSQLHFRVRMHLVSGAAVMYEAERRLIFHKVPCTWSNESGKLLAH